MSLAVEGSRRSSHPKRGSLWASIVSATPTFVTYPESKSDDRVRETENSPEPELTSLGLVAVLTICVALIYSILPLVRPFLRHSGNKAACCHSFGYPETILTQALSGARSYPAFSFSREVMVNGYGVSLALGGSPEGSSTEPHIWLGARIKHPQDAVWPSNTVFTLALINGLESDLSRTQEFTYRDGYEWRGFSSDLSGRRYNSVNRAHSGLGETFIQFTNLETLDDLFRSGFASDRELVVCLGVWVKRKEGEGPKLFEN